MYGAWEQTGSTANCVTITEAFLDELCDIRIRLEARGRPTECARVAALEAEVNRVSQQLARTAQPIQGGLTVRVIPPPSENEDGVVTTQPSVSNAILLHQNPLIMLPYRLHR